VTPRDAFLRAILERPGDDTPRLVYADWLDEHGDAADQARARLIRLQCARGDRRRSSRSPGAEEEKKLLDEFGPRWEDEVFAGLKRDEVTASFQRGFVGIIRCPLARWQELGPTLVRRAPLGFVELTDRSSAGGDSPPILEWRWVEEGLYDRDRCHLPPEIFRHLPGEELTVAGERWRSYASFVDALNAASAACLAWAREAAGPS
jgi:uncharacterized protein (TIGR02996 family)